MERQKSAPDCSKCTFYHSCNDPEKAEGHFCVCYELETRTAWCSTCKQYLPISSFRKNSLRSNGFCSSCRPCERKRETSILGRYKSYRRNARQRNLDFNLSKEDFIKLVFDKCNYCGEYGSPYNGIDRVDNIKGYTVSNCVPCCEWCNKIKMTHTIEEMVDHIKKMYKCIAG